MSDPLRRWAFPSLYRSLLFAILYSRENPLLPPERQLLSRLFHCRFKAEDRFQAIQPGFGVRGERLQWGPLYEPPATASNRRPQGRGSLQFERRERPPLVGQREEPEHPVVVRDLLADRREPPVQARGPVELPEEHHLPAVVPGEVDRVEHLGRSAQRPRERRRLLLIR